MNKNKGISLIALIVTIIVLLILAGISISNLTENGLFEKTKLAKEEHEISVAQEALNTELLTILTEHQGKKDLNNLDGMTINGYDTQVSKTGKIVTMTKNSETYYFLVDSEYNIQNLNNISSSVGGGGNNQNPGNVSNSQLINDFKIKIESMKNFSVNVNIDGEITTTDNSDILGYIVFLNGVGIKNTTVMPYTISGLEKNTEYVIDVMAIDKNGNTKKSISSISATTPNAVEKELEYPVMTADGIKNKKFVGSNENDYYYELDLTKECLGKGAAPKSLYDGDHSNYIDLGGSCWANRGIFEVDSSAVGNTWKVDYTGGRPYIVTYKDFRKVGLEVNPNSQGVVSGLTNYVISSQYATQITITEDMKYISIWSGSGNFVASEIYQNK